MAETDQTLVSTYDAFSAARGEEMDHLWAFSVSWKLMMNDVEVEQVREGLEEALALVRETQESPENLFGDPKEHASELYRRWKSEGQLRLTHGEKVVAARSIPGSSLHAGAWVALMTAAVDLLDGRDPMPVGFLALPVGLGFASIGGLALWERASRRWATPVAVTVMTAATLVFAFLMGSVLMSTEASFGSAMPWILVAEAVVLWFAGRCLTALATAKAVAVARDGLDDEQWVERFSGILRGPAWTPAARVREIVAEARSHAAETGRTLAEEFGTPEHYASQFGVDQARRSRLKIAFLVALVGLNLFQMLDGYSWPNIGLAVLLGWMAWQEFWEYRKHQEGREPRAQSAR